MSYYSDYYYAKAIKYIDNATDSAGLYEGVRKIMTEAMEAETPLKDTYPEDWQVKRIQRHADAKYTQLLKAEKMEE